MQLQERLLEYEKIVEQIGVRESTLDWYKILILMEFLEDWSPLQPCKTIKPSYARPLQNNDSSSVKDPVVLLNDIS